MSQTDNFTIIVWLLSQSRTVLVHIAYILFVKYTLNVTTKKIRAGPTTDHRQEGVLSAPQLCLSLRIYVCCDEAVARAVESLWKKCFVTDAPIPHQT